MRKERSYCEIKHFLQEHGLQVENVNLLAARGNLFGHVFSQLNSGTVIATLE